MNDVQKHLLSLLKEIDEICREHGIEYYIDGGTALGAIRHRGFLPWDDDADIMLTRDNWEKFKRVMREHPRENRVVEDLHSNDKYTMVYGRYCDTSTTCILRTSMIDQFKSGVFIDLFILDPIPDTPESRKEYFEILGGYCEYLNPYYYDEIVGANEWYERFKKMGAEKGRKAVIDFVEKRLFSYPDQEGMTYGFRYDNGHWIYPRDVVGKGRRVMVEGVSLPIAERAEDYLRIHYGDLWYMIPSATEAETHNVVIDLNVPYQSFADTYMPQIDRKKAVQTYEKLHDLRVRSRMATAAVDTANYTRASQIYCAALSKKTEKLGVSLKKLIARGEYDRCREILDNYYDMQLNRWFMFYRVFVPVTDEQLYCALYLMLVDGNYPKADKILSLRRERPEKLSDDLKVIENLIEELRACVRSFENGDLENVLRITQKQLKAHPDIRDFAEHKYRAEALKVLGCKDRARARKLVNQIEMQTDLLGRDWIQAVLAMLKLRFGAAGEQVGAREILEDLEQNCRNGMLRLAVMDFMSEIIDD